MIPRKQMKIRKGMVLGIVLVAFSGIAHCAALNQVLVVSTPVPRSAAAPEDFNGDGLSDLLWYDSATSRIAYWIMATDSSGAVSRASYRIFDIPSGSQVSAVGDFNGDGLADIALTDGNGDLTEWINNGKGGFATLSLGSYPAGWRLFGAGDINGDGVDDLLWMNDGACKFGYWSMHDGRRVGATILPVACGTQPLSIGYYSLDNRLSIIWTDASRDLSVWDFTRQGYNSSDLGNYDYSANARFLALGGGYAGGNMSFIFLSDVGSIESESMQRTFYISGEQASFARMFSSSGGVSMPIGAGGFFVETRGGIDKTGNIFTYGLDSIGVCPPVSGESFSSGPTARVCVRFDTSGWYLIGSDINGLQ